MLQAIRERSKGWIAAVIVGLLIICFAFWGVSSYSGQGGGVIVVKVNGNDIKLRSYQRAFNNMRQKMRNVLKNTLTQVDDALIKEEVLKQLVDIELQNQVIADIGLQVSDDAIRESIRNLQLFQDEHGFSKELYERGISSFGMSPQSFERQMRLDILAEQLQGALAESGFVTSEEVSRIASLKGQKRDIIYTILNADDYKDSISITEDEITRYFEEHTQLYIEPEQVKIAFIDLDIDKLAEKVSVTEDDLRTHYENNRADYEVAEQRQIKQLFVRVNTDASEEELESARKKAESLKELVQSGKSFEDIVDKHADDPGPLFEYSEHGFMSRGIVQAEVDEFLFSGKEGDLSEPIKSEKGFHVVRIGKIKGGPKNTFENSRDDVEKDYRHHRAEEQFFELGDQFAGLAYEHPDTLEIAAEAIGVEIQESDFFSRNSSKEGIISEPKIISASFSEDVMINGNNSEAIELGDNRIVVLRVNEHRAERKKSLESIRTEVVDAIRFKKLAEITSELGQEIIKQLQTGTDPEQVVADKGFKWSYAEGVTRDDVNVTRSVLRLAFRLGIPDTDQPVTGGTSLGTGSYAVVSVRSVESPALEDIDEEVLKTTREQLNRREANNEWSDFIGDIREQADIKIFRDNI